MAALLLAAGLLVAGAAGAQIQVDAMAPKPTEPPAISTADGAIQLSLDQAVEIALRQNLGLVIQRYVRSQSRLDILEQLGIYDLRSDATLSATNSEQQSLDPSDPTRLERQRFNFGFSQLAPWGGDFTIGLNNSRTAADFRSITVDPTFSSNVDFGYVQPLLRNFGRIPTERGLLIARLGSQISHEELERQLALTIQQVTDAYWNLVEAREQLGVSRESLGLARELHARNRIEVEVGTRAPLELVQSEATIATREEDIIRSQAAVGDAADQLRRLLNLPPGELWELPVEPTTRPETEERPTIDVEAAIRTAFEERPELRQQRLAIEQSEVNAAFFRNQKLPRLDLTVSYSESALDTDFGRTLRQILDRDETGWTTQLVFAYPLQNRTARAQSASAEIDVERTTTELEDLEAAIRTEVRQAVRAVETAAQQIVAARASRQFQERNLEAERKRYENGMSTSFQITQIQEDLTLARSRVVTATINYRRALTDYYRVTGRLLEEEGVQLLDPEDEVDRFTFF